jgi:alkylhydroperoxidase family enzyme
MSLTDTDVTWMPAPLFARVPYEELDEEQRARWDYVNAKSGQAVHVEVFANHQVVEDFYIKDFYPKLFFGADGDMLVDQRLKELFRFRMGRQHGCHVCNTANVDTFLAAGYSHEQMDHVLDPSPELFTDEELAIIELADLFVLQHTDAQLTPDLYERLRRHFSDAQILELGVMGAFFMGWQRLFFAYDLVPREATCPLPNPGGARSR